MDALTDLVIIAVGILSWFGGFYTALRIFQIEELRKENDRLRGRLYKLETELKTALDEIARLSADLAALRDCNEN